MKIRNMILLYILLIVITKYVAQYDWTATLWVSLVFVIYIIVFPPKKNNV